MLKCLGRGDGGSRGLDHRWLPLPLRRPHGGAASCVARRGRKESPPPRHDGVAPLGLGWSPDGRTTTCPVRSVAAGEVERAVVEQLRAVFRAPELVARTAREAGALAAAESDRLRREERELRDRLRVLRQRVARLLAAKGDDAGTIAEALRRAGAPRPAGSPGGNGLALRQG